MSLDSFVSLQGTHGAVKYHTRSALCKVQYDLIALNIPYSGIKLVEHQVRFGFGFNAMHHFKRIVEQDLGDTDILPFDQLIQKLDAEVNTGNLEDMQRLGGLLRASLDGN